MNIFMPPRSKIGGYIVFVLSVILSFCPPLWNFKLANNFWIVSARAFIFHMNISCDKTFPWIPIFLILWPWPWSLIHLLKTSTLLFTFELWVLELFLFHMSIPCDMTFPWFNYFLINIRASYCTWAFLATRSSYWYQDIYPCDLDHLWNGHYRWHLCFTNTSSFIIY